MFSRCHVCRNGSGGKAASGFGGGGGGASPKGAARVQKAGEGDRKWELQPVDVPEWLQWIAAQQATANVAEGGSPARAAPPSAAAVASGTPPQRLVGTVAAGRVAAAGPHIFACASIPGAQLLKCFVESQNTRGWAQCELPMPHGQWQPVQR